MPRLPSCRHIALLLLVLLLAACRRDGSAPRAVATAAPTAAVAQASATPAPPTATSTATATATQTPTPSHTPTATATATITPSPTPPYTVEYETDDCKFLAFLVEVEVECGYLTVPEQRAHPNNGRTVRLHVAIFKSANPHPEPDPVIYLDGGPGANSLQTIPYVFDELFGQFITNRDFIVFDQRGTGYSEPALGCPEVSAANRSLVQNPLPAAAATELVVNAFRDCHDRLVAEEDVNFAAFNSAENAADVADLRRALGYDEWNLYGISYGTRLAQTIIRDDPQGVRSVILDSVYPPAVNLLAEGPANLDRAFDTLFNGCAADFTCNTAYPDLKTIFFDLVVELNENPVPLTVNDFLTGTDVDVLFDGNTLIAILFQTLYSADLIPTLPQLIYHVNNGQYGEITYLLTSMLFGGEGLSAGMYIAVQCYDEVSLTDPRTVTAAGAAFPEYADYFASNALFSPALFDLCDYFGVGDAPVLENTPVDSDVPILVMAGQYDPITPPEWGAATTRHFRNSFYFLFPGLGHGVSLSDSCPLRIARTFLNDPDSSPNDACIREMSSPDFSPPSDRSTTIVLTSVLIDVNGQPFASVAPEGWEQVDSGTFARQRDALDIAFLLQQASQDITPEQFLDLFTRQAGLADNPPQANGTYNDGRRVWELYRSELLNNQMDIALVVDDGWTYVVILLSPAGEETLLFEAVFLPVLDAFRAF